MNDHAEPRRFGVYFLVVAFQTFVGDYMTYEECCIPVLLRWYPRRLGSYTPALAQAWIRAHRPSLPSPHHRMRDRCEQPGERWMMAQVGSEHALYNCQT